METNKLKNLAKGLMTLSAIALLANSIIACKGSNNTPQNQNAFIQNCTNCQNITGTPFFTAESTDYYRVLRMTWSFSGQANNSNSQNYGYQNNNNPYGNQYANPYGNQYGNYYNNNYYNQYNYSPVMSYSGQVSAIGQIYISRAMSLFCQIPSGTYSFTTQSAGQWSGGQVSGLKITASGPVGITATLSSAQVITTNNGYQYSQSSGRISGTLMLEAANGVSCNGAPIYLY